jgi:hypothetical protein
MHDLVSTADIQIGLAAGAFSQGCDDYAGEELNAQQGGQPRPYAPTVTRRTPSFVIASADLGGKLTIVVIDRLGREGFDGECVCDDFDVPRSVTVLACGGATGSGLHGIYFLQMLALQTRKR